jgi:uncharacterized protein (DUF1778 family)
MSTTVLSVRVSAEERALLEAASESARTNISDFVRRKALDAAEIDFMERRSVVIPAEHWESFEAWLHRPGEVKPKLRKLLRSKAPWDK